MDHYETLGVDRDASADEIKAAARREASKHHPDRGGDPQRMAMVNQARDVLLDSERRARYDETGSDAPHGSLRQAGEQMLQQLFSQALSITERNMLTWIRSKTHALKNAALERKSEALAEINRLKKRRDNIKAKTGENLLHMVIDRQIHDLEARAAEADQMLDVVDEARKLLDDYESSEERPEPRNEFAGSAFYSSPFGGIRFGGGL